jgi:hypothetical protein
MRKWAARRRVVGSQKSVLRRNQGWKQRRADKEDGSVKMIVFTWGNVESSINWFKDGETRHV